MSKMESFYESILNFLGLQVNADGFVSLDMMDGTFHPMLVDKKRLVMPTRTHLNTPGDKMIFHPLSESVTRGKSEIIEKINDLLNIRLNTAISLLMWDILRLAESPALHDKLTQEQTEGIIACVSDSNQGPDEALQEKWSRIINAAAIKNCRDAYIHVFLNRGGTINGKRYARTGVVQFPFLAALEKGGELFGVKTTTKDRSILKNLFLWIFPKADVKDHYSRGTDSMMAPYLEALLHTAFCVASRLEKVGLTYKEHLSDPERVIFNLSWVDLLGELEGQEFKNLIRLIPPQEGNVGKASIQDKKLPTTLPSSVIAAAAQSLAEPERPAVTATVQQPQVVQVQAQQPQVVQMQAPQQQVQYIQTPNGLQQVIVQAPQPQVVQVQAQQPQYVQVQTPNGVVLQQVQPQMAQAGGGEIRTTSKGVDFSSVLAATPALQMVPNQLAMAQPQIVQQRRDPSWASDGIAPVMVAVQTPNGIVMQQVQPQQQQQQVQYVQNPQTVQYVQTTNGMQQVVMAPANNMTYYDQNGNRIG